MKKRILILFTFMIMATATWAALCWYCDDAQPWCGACDGEGSEMVCFEVSPIWRDCSGVSVTNC